MRPTSSVPIRRPTVSSNRWRRVASAPRETSALAIEPESELSTMLLLIELEPTFRTRTRPSSVGPGPVPHVRLILTMVPCVLAVAQPLVHHPLPHMPGAGAKPRNAVDDIHHQVEAIQIVQHHHVERRRGGSLFLVATHV